ncbi:MAG: hypothetical protein O7B99_15380, partial [Planctomycetota bacterium]|nr:hypothetical protein [Planctomycetota bacterium]
MPVSRAGRRGGHIRWVGVAEDELTSFFAAARSAVGDPDPDPEVRTPRAPDHIPTSCHRRAGRRG